MAQYNQDSTEQRDLYVERETRRARIAFLRAAVLAQMDGVLTDKQLVQVAEMVGITAADLESIAVAG